MSCPPKVHTELGGSSLLFHTPDFKGCLEVNCSVRFYSVLGMRSWISRAGCHTLCYLFSFLQSIGSIPTHLSLINSGFSPFQNICMSQTDQFISFILLFARSLFFFQRGLDAGVLKAGRMVFSSFVLPALFCFVNSLGNG